MKLRSQKLNEGIKTKCLDALFNAVKHAKEKDMVSRFLSDILTESEQVMLGRRILIAAKLLENQTYDKIVREMNVGQDTVYRVKKWLGGRHKGYEKVVEKIKKIAGPRKQKSEFKDYYPTGGFAEVKRRYKNYYWLSDLLDEINRNIK